ncbi:MAG: hypothetical protein PWR01_4265 [Clostridiales bacterium]|nr:hypothetical protein [Clostridiales bacterium]MDN5283192.1 hypothetical protein [Candidatus Ozemobacter sp.]
MLDFILKKFVPFGIARTLSLAAIPLFQIIVAVFCSKEEAGRFFIISTLAFIASQIGDLGVSRAFPVVFGENDKATEESIAEINAVRWLTGAAAGLLFLLFDSFGPVKWTFATGILAMAFCLGRVILLGNQGFRHARQRYDLLLRGSWLHVVSVSIFFLVFAVYGKISAESAFGALTVGVWVELLSLDARNSHPGLRMSSQLWGRALQIIYPYASLGVLVAIFNRSESFVSGKVLQPAELGIFGTLDAALKLCIWPSYLSAQTLFPAIRDAIEKKSSPQLANALKKHLILSLPICFSAMLVSFLFWNLKFSQVNELDVAAALLWLTILMAVPDAFLIPLYYSLRLEKAYRKLMFRLTILRLATAISLGLKFGLIGLCLSYFAATLISILALWLRLKKHLRSDLILADE